MNSMWTTTLIVLAFAGSVYAQANGFCTFVWGDEFNGPTLDLTKWQIEQTCNGGGNDELECYTARPQNVYLQNGALVLHAQKETYTGTQAGCTDSQGCTNTKSFTSGRINSSPTDAGAFLYGRVEARLKLCSGSHLWPAFWMLPKDYAYGGWAASGEIDIMEQRGDIPTSVSGTLQHGDTWPNNIYTTSGAHAFNNQDLSADFHVYAVEWTASTMTWYVDNNAYQTYNLIRWWNTSATLNPYTAMGQPWDKREYILFNVAVGGGFFNGYPALTDQQVAAWVSSSMTIDWVRVWKQGGDCSTATPTTAATTQAPTTANPTQAPTTAQPTQPTQQTTSNKPTQQTIPTIITASPSDNGDNVQSSVQAGMTAQTAMIISASVGGVALILGIAAIVVGAIFIFKARRNLMMPALPTSPSQARMLG